MICPHWVNYSMMVGAVISWGLMWPLLRGMEGAGREPSAPLGSPALQHAAMHAICVFYWIEIFEKASLAA
jgi:hypothetical protein